MTMRSLSTSIPVVSVSKPSSGPSVQLIVSCSFGALVLQPDSHRGLTSPRKAARVPSRFGWAVRRPGSLAR